MTNEEYPAWARMRFGKPCLKITLASGVRDAVLKYQSHQVRADELRVTLRDIKYGPVCRSRRTASTPGMD